MRTKYFTLDSISSQRYGIQMQRGLEFEQPKPRVETVSVKGRNGDLLYYDGSFENVRCTASCFILHEQIYDHLAEAIKWMSVLGYRKLSFEGDEQAFRLASITNLPAVQVRMHRLAPFEVEWTCKPQRFLLSGEDEYTFTQSGNLHNPAFEGLPLFQVFGTSGAISVNGHNISISDIDGFIWLDFDTQNAYKGINNQNNKINAVEFPKLVAGDNEILITGNISKVVIKPRWYTL